MMSPQGNKDEFFSAFVLMEAGYEKGRDKSESNFERSNAYFCLRIGVRGSL